MERKTPNHILPPKVQEQLAKDTIEEALRDHNLQENVEIIYLLIKTCLLLTDDSMDIDIRVKNIVEKYDKKQAADKEEESKKDHNKYDVYTK